MSSAGKAAIAVQGHAQVAWGAWGAVRLVAGGREPRECGSCRVCSIKCVEVLCDDPVSRHDPPARDFQPSATNLLVPRTPHTPCTWPCPAWAACAAFHAVVAFPPDLVAPLVNAFRGPKTGRVSHSAHQTFRARTPDPMDVPSLHVRLVR